MSESSSPRGSPVRMPEGLRKLIRETYGETDKRLWIERMIRDHLDDLNRGEEYESAREFLLQEEETIREEAKRLAIERRRAPLRLVARIAGPAILVIVARSLETIVTFVKSIF
jgi:hypothetical protein